MDEYYKMRCLRYALHYKLQIIRLFVIKSDKFYTIFGII